MRLPWIVVGIVGIACRAAPDHIEQLPPAPAPAMAPGTIVPTSKPAIEFRRFNYAWGPQDGTVSLWKDGTVQFRGERCGHLVSRTARLPSSRVVALLDALDRGGMFDYQPRCEHLLMDGETTVITMRIADGEHIVEQRTCADTWPLFDEAVDRISTVVGQNPCE